MIVKEYEVRGKTYQDLFVRILLCVPLSLEVKMLLFSSTGRIPLM